MAADGRCPVLAGNVGGDRQLTGIVDLGGSFVSYLRGEAEMLVNPSEALNVVRAIEARYRSAAEGREIQTD